MGDLAENVNTLREYVNTITKRFEHLGFNNRVGGRRNEARG